MKQLGGLNGHRLFQNGVLLQIPLREFLTLFIGVVAGFLEDLCAQAHKIYVGVRGRILIYRPPGGDVVTIQRHTVDDNIIEYL